MVVKLVALVSSQPAKESQAGWAGAVLLCKYVQVITCSESPSSLLHPIGEKQVTCPAHTSGGRDHVWPIQTQSTILVIDLGC